MLKTLGFLPKVGTCHFNGEIPPGKTRVEKWVVFAISVIICFHETKCLGVFLRLATVTAIVNTDLKNFSMCTSKKDNIFFENWLPRRRNK
jgi:hypothetical protein